MIDSKQNHQCRKSSQSSLQVNCSNDFNSRGMNPSFNNDDASCLRSSVKASYKEDFGMCGGLAPIVHNSSSNTIIFEKVSDDHSVQTSRNSSKTNVTEQRFRAIFCIL